MSRGSADVARWINQRTWGRVRNLSVECDGGRVIVHGCAGSYYHKQLALAAAMETVNPEWLVFNVDVAPVRTQN